jgi:hypothetical protein
MNSVRRQNMTTVVTGRALGTFNVSQTAQNTTVSEVNLTISNLGARIISIADTFEYWRMTKLRVKGMLLTGASTAGATAGSTTRGDAYFYGIAFNPITNVDTTVPANITTTLDYPEWDFGSGTKSLVISVGSSGLWRSMATPWLTTSTTPDAILQSAGTVTIVSISPAIADASIAAVIRVVEEFEIEFKSPVDPAVTPLYLPLQTMQTYNTWAFPPVREASRPLSEYIISEEDEKDISDEKSQKSFPLKVVNPPSGRSSSSRR